MTLTLSVVTPSYQQGVYIRRTIDSVLSQNVPCTYTVMDGGSTDETVAILESYGNRLTFVSERDRGQAHAVNKALAVTDGDIIGWLNSDDVYFPGTLRRVMDYFESHPEVDFVYGRGHHIDEHDNFINEYPTEPWNPARMWETCFFCQPAVFFRRRVIEMMGPLDEHLNYCMDYEFWLRGIERGMTFAFIPEVLSGSRLYPTNKTLGAAVKVHAEINDMIKAKTGTVTGDWISHYAHKVLEQRGQLDRSDPAFHYRLQKEILFARLHWLGAAPLGQTLHMARLVAGLWLKSRIAVSRAVLTRKVTP